MEAIGSWEILFSPLGYERMGTGGVTAWTALMLIARAFGHSPWKAEIGERPIKCRKVSGAKRAWSPATRV